jgi:hypothetical protein
MRFPIQVTAPFAALFLALLQMSCSKSVVGPIPGPADATLLDESFERDGQPTLQGWRIANPSVTTLVPEPGPGGGGWSLGLEADWTPTSGLVIRPIPGIQDGDVLRLSALVRAVDAAGGGTIILSVGPRYGLRGNRVKWASAASTSWTHLSVQDTVTLPPGDTVWVTLSSFHTEFIRRQGRFDLVTLKRISEAMP